MARKRALFFHRLLSLLVPPSRLLSAGLLGVGLVSGLIASQPLSVQAKTSPVLSVQPGNTWQQGIELYQAEQYSAAIATLEAALKTTPEHTPDQGRILTYLALAYQKLGQWDKAQSAIASSLQLWSSLPNSEFAGYAQALNAKGQGQLARGEAEPALETWKQATALYQQLGDRTGVTGSLINQAQALQTLGLYQQALQTLERLHQQLQPQPDSLEKALGYRSLGNALRVVGDLEQSRQVLEKSLAIARGLPASSQATSAIANTLMSLGSTTQAQAQPTEAQQFYQQAIATTPQPLTQVQARLNLLQLLLETRQWDKIQPLTEQLHPQLAQLTPSRAALYARLNYVENLIRFKQALLKGRTLKSETPGLSTPTASTQLLASRGQRAASERPLPETILSPTPEPSSPQISGTGPGWLNLAQETAIALQQAQTLGDLRGQSHALGILGHVYEQTQQWQTAQDLTEQALLLSQSIQASDISYRWQWQLGRILKAIAQTSDNPTPTSDRALQFYQEAITTLKSLRTDLVAINPEVQFTFRDSVEPVYREYVSLLLRPTAGTAKTKAIAEPTQENLIQARNAIEALQLAELENFFRQACLDSTPVQIDQVDRTAAVFYPIILSDRLEVIVSLPGKPLRHYSTDQPQPQLETTLKRLRRQLTTLDSTEYFSLSEQVYDWLIRPIDADLKASQIKTLVFILDGPLRNIPLSALYDGKQFLIEQYGLAIAPGLQLVDVKPVARERLQVLAGGLSEARQGFNALPSVLSEINQIQTSAPSQTFLNTNFTSQELSDRINQFNGSIIHLATHGEFSSNADKTYILTWDDRININQLSHLLRTKATSRQNAIELLVLSACRTAVGDNRAALGLAGVAVRAGARSTIGTLWYVDDSATSSVMAKFYQEFTNTSISKAEALRRAQLTLLQSRKHKHPYFWAPFILVGNWL